MTATRRFPPPCAHAWVVLFNRGPFVVLIVVLAILAVVTRQSVLAVAGPVGAWGAVFLAEHVFKPLWEYPSAHVTAAAACATVAWFVLRHGSRASALVFLVPLVVSWAVIEQRTHLPADAIGGLLLGPLVIGATVLLTTWAAGTLHGTGRAGAPIGVSDTGRHLVSPARARRTRRPREQK